MIKKIINKLALKLLRAPVVCPMCTSYLMVKQIVEYSLHECNDRECDFYIITDGNDYTRYSFNIIHNNCKYNFASSRYEYNLDGCGRKKSNETAIVKYNSNDDCQIKSIPIFIKYDHYNIMNGFHRMINLAAFF